MKNAKQIGLVAVTGATGLIGRRLIPTLANAGLKTRVLLRSGVRPSAVEQILGDLRDEEALQRLVSGVHTVVHLAGLAHTRLHNAAEEETAKQINVEGTRKLVGAAASAGARHFVFMSSAHVYRGQAGLNLTEHAPTDGDTTYGRLKLEAEQIVSAARSPLMRVTILRPCLVYGPGARFNLQSLMRGISKRYYARVRGADAVRSMASVDTVAAAILHLLETESEDTTFNVADRTPVRLEEWTNHLADLMRVKRPRTVPAALMRSAASIGSILRALGLPAPITRDTLRKLASDFSISTDRLASTGFTWPETRETVLREMISAEFSSRA